MELHQLKRTPSLTASSYSARRADMVSMLLWYTMSTCVAPTRRAVREASIAVLPQPMTNTRAPLSTCVSLGAMRPSEINSTRRRKWVASRMRIRSVQWTAPSPSEMHLPFCQMGISSDFGLPRPVPMKMASKPCAKRLSTVISTPTCVLRWMTTPIFSM